MRKFSVRPAITLRGRTFKGLRGWSGKPLHPPLTDFPVAGYVLAAVFDFISAIGGDSHGWSRDFFRAGTYTIIGGAAVSVLTALTGFWDWLKSSEPGTQARRTINTHATIMLTVTALAIADIVWRLIDYDSQQSTPIGILILSIVIAVLVSWGATYGGTLIFDYGFNVETAGDSPVWHKSEINVMPGQRHDGQA
jgi:uncharacterized membrane protein